MSRHDDIDDSLKDLYRQASAEELASAHPDFDRTWAAATSSASSPRAEHTRRRPALLGGALAAALLLILSVALLRPDAPIFELPESQPMLASPTAPSPPISDQEWEELASLADDIWSWQAPTDTLLDDAFDGPG